VDAGNVWNWKKDTLFPGGELNTTRFYNEIGLNTGFGARFDFDFLLLRFDWGVPVWDPNYPLEERLVIRDALKNAWLFKRPIWNVAVGYPF
jgi:outer membrane protein assembly factor BamA